MSAEAETLLYFVGSGLLLGFSGGVAPGPLSALVISQTLRFGVREGMIVAFAPLITDVALVLASGWLASEVTQIDGALGGISIVGAGAVWWLAWESFSATTPVPAEGEQPRSLLKSILVNLLNPHPYIFWFLVGGPIVAKAIACGVQELTLFLAGFFFSLVGAKVLLAWVTQYFRAWLLGAFYRRVMQGLGIALFLFGVGMLIDGVNRVLEVLG